MTTNKVHEWTKNKRWDKFDENGKHVIEDVCEHGVGHEWGTHGCDGCCAGIYPAPEKQQQAPQEKCHVEIPSYDEDGTEKDSDYWFMCLKTMPCPVHSTPPQEPTPTSVTGEEWREEVARYYAWMTSANNFSPDIRIKAWQDFIGHLLSTQRTHIKQALLGRVADIPEQTDKWSPDIDEFQKRVTSIINEELA